MIVLSGQSISCEELEAGGLIGQLTASECITLQDPSFMAPCECSTTALTSEYDLTRPSASPTLQMPTSPSTDLVSLHIPTNNSTTKLTEPSVPPSILIATIEPTIANVDLPSQSPSSFPSSSIHHLAVTVPSPNFTTPLSKKPTLSKDPTSSSLESDLVFTSENSEEDFLNVDDENVDNNPGAGIGMGLLVVTPVAILVVGIIYEIKRRKRRNRNKTILPLRNNPTQKYHVTRQARQSATKVQNENAKIDRSVPSSNATSAVLSKSEISAYGGALKETKAAATAEAATFLSTQNRSVPTRSAATETTGMATATFLSTQNRSVPTRSAATETTGKATASSSKSEISANDAGAVKVTKEATADVGTSRDERSVKSSSSSQSGSVRSLFSLTSERSVKSVSEAKESKKATADVDAQSEEIIVKNAGAAKETKKATTDVSTLPDDDEMMSVKSSSSSITSQSSGSVMSMTSLVIERGAKSVSDAKGSREATDYVGTSTDKSRARVKNSNNSSRIVKKDDAVTFFDMLSTLQIFFDCNGDITTNSSTRTPS